MRKAEAESLEWDALRKRWTIGFIWVHVFMHVCMHGLWLTISLFTAYIMRNSNTRGR